MSNRGTKNIGGEEVFMPPMKKNLTTEKEKIKWQD